MAVSPLSVLVGILLLFFAPGFALLHAVFPGRRYFGPFHPLAMPAMSVVMSSAITVVVGSALGFLGLFQGLQTGAPYLELALGTIAIAASGVAWRRGAFPLLGRAAEYDNVGERGEPEEVTMLRDLRLEEERLRKEASRVRKRASQSRDLGVRGALSEAANDLDRDRKDVEKRARDVEKRGGERRYGLTAGKRTRDRWGGR